MDEAGWERLDLYGAAVEAWRHAASGRFRLRVAGQSLEFGPENREALEALLLALADAKRALTGEDFVPAKTLPAPRREDPSVVPVRFEPEDLEYLRTRVRVGKEPSLDEAVGRAVKAYMRDLLTRHERDDAEAPRAPRASAPAQRTLAPPESAALTGVGAIQRALLALAAKRGHVTRLDVGRAYGITASRRNASGARVKAESAVNALVARGLLRQEQRGPDTVWVLTETGRVLVEETER